MASQPDLFANNLGERLAEARRHGGGVRPRFISDPANDEGECEPYYSPVQFAEELRRHERR